MRAVFESVRASPWFDDTPDSVVMEIARGAFRDIVAGGGYTRGRRFTRLAGQSGSGKTTQLLPAVMNYEESRGRKPVAVAIREFAKYHPRWREINEKYDPRDVREVTNGFALKLCMCVLAMLLKGGYCVVLEVTVLSPAIEKYILDLAVAEGYAVVFHVLAVDKKTSDTFAAKRVERYVARESSDYFYDVLPEGLGFWVENLPEGFLEGCFVWGAFQCEPLHSGGFGGVLGALERGRNKPEIKVTDEGALLDAKMRYLQDFV